MIEILPAAPHVAAFRVTGVFTGDDYDRCVAEIEARLAAHPRIGMFCDMAGMTRLSAEALAKDVRYSIGKIGQYERFARVALITGRDWMDKAMEFSSKVLPRTETATFESGEQDAALAWASDVPAPEPPT